MRIYCTFSKCCLFFTVIQKFTIAGKQVSAKRAEDKSQQDGRGGENSHNCLKIAQCIVFREIVQLVNLKENSTLMSNVFSPQRTSQAMNFDTYLIKIGQEIRKLRLFKGG